MASIDYITAKLEEIHNDVRLLKTQVDDLRQDQAGRRAVTKFIFGTIAVLGAAVGWLVDNAVTMSRHIL